LSTDFRKIFIKFHENFSVGAELFQADGQTDRHDEASRFFGNLRAGLKSVF